MCARCSGLRGPAIATLVIRSSDGCPAATTNGRNTSFGPSKVKAPSAPSSASSAACAATRPGDPSTCKWTFTETFYQYRWSVATKQCLLPHTGGLWLQPDNSLPKALQAEFGSCVDLDMQAVHDDMDGGPGAPVSRIGRHAHGADAADEGNALGGAGSEDDDLHGARKLMVEARKLEAESRTRPARRTEKKALRFSGAPCDSILRDGQ